MKTLLFQNHLSIRMDAPVSMHHYTLKCLPSGNANQHVLWLNVQVEPFDFLSRNTDQWGNDYLYGLCRRPHTSFDVNVTGLVQTGLDTGISEQNENHSMIFRYATLLTAADPELARFARVLGSPDDNIYGWAQKTMHAVHESIAYRPGTTDVRTTASQAFALRSGVCQDYAHVMLALARIYDIPSRYVVGMMIGEGQSHAWVELLDHGIWRGFDPTNGQEVDDNYIRISHGRDYTDCIINKGVFGGGCRQTAHVSVTVTETEE